MGGKVIARGIGLGVVAMALHVAIAAGWVWFYSVAINPGHAGEVYQFYGQRVAPIIAITFGIPILFLVGWLAARGTRSSLAPFLPALTFLVIDVAMNAVGGLWPPAWSLALSYLTKFAAAWAGGSMARRKRPA